MQPWDKEEALLARLRSGDEAAFAVLVDDLHGRLSTFARTFTASPALAEDIVQETWLGVIRGLHAFEGRSSLRTWIFSILVRRARTMAAREARRPGHGSPDGEAVVEWEPGRGRVGLWEEAPVSWALEDPATIYQSHEVLEIVRAAVAGLPDVQQQVVLLRDVEGLPAKDVCNILDLSETNQRVLLHRGRSRVRRAIDRYVRNGARPPAAVAHQGWTQTTQGHAKVLDAGAPRAGATDAPRGENGEIQ